MMNKPEKELRDKIQAMKRKAYIKEDNKTILNLASSHEHKSIYNIGIVDKYGISIVEQQNRAFLLAHVLIETKKLNRNSKVAVIGAGAAGLSFAVAAAMKSKCQVIVFEKENILLPLLSRVHWRWVVPFQEFLESGYFAEDTNLPFLNWEADFSWKVARNLKRKWEIYKSNYNIKEKFDSKVTIPTQSGGSKPKILVNGKSYTFDIVIIAAGFGQVDELGKKDNYWTTGAPKDYIRGKNREKVLISGNGDAGLVELFHYCIKDFYHDDILSFYDWKARGTTLRYLMDSMKGIRKHIANYRNGFLESDEDKLHWAENYLQLHEIKPKKNKQFNREEKLKMLEDHYNKRINEHLLNFDKMFKTINFEDSYLDFVKKHLREDFDITLNGLENLMFNAEKEVNPHNMLLASALYRLRAFKYVGGKFTKERKKIKGRKVVTLNDRKYTFDRVIVRHGKIESSVPNLTFKSSVKYRFEDEPVGWRYFMGGNYKKFFHTPEIKKFLIQNYLGEIGSMEANEVWKELDKTKGNKTT